MAYQHQFSDDSTFEYPLGKVVCVGRNYAEHAKELNNPIPSSPILFIKPATTVTPFAEAIVLPKGKGDTHYETELAILIGQKLTAADANEVEAAIVGYGLALDLTLRELQSELKAKGHPWEVAKSFDGACPLSAFVHPDAIKDPLNIEFTLKINGELRQHGHTNEMITAIAPLLAFISQHFTLMPGDVVLTGTPAGVGVLPTGAKLEAELESVLHIETTVK
ncbi:fumarylacetoacetate hydrolase family protein [Alkalimarinus sediminis]|uniref:Fumarylacetoacetate hydrolase family protein n=1 Tax=Alkalimarinus sediminis TaxID=1632866 RepID=A0A9E8HPZ4_9ALTE|nr:fumarylacetoacetate hydrolase family protein [Alkalimarinus sediminis]UZW73679.1 fumarylacetoacetate hydrolase family protein [Alkalimarinus sediminis]